jgi:hypothetical protein
MLGYLRRGTQKDWELHKWCFYHCQSVLQDWITREIQTPKYLKYYHSENYQKNWPKVHAERRHERQKKYSIRVKEGENKHSSGWIMVMTAEV